MVFQGFDTAHQIIKLVENLAECKIQLEEFKTESGAVDNKLEGITLDLAAIAQQLFKYTLSVAVDKEEQICDEKLNIPGSGSLGVSNIGVASGKKAARVCENGYKCVYGQKGICDFYHPEEGKSREPVCQTIINTPT